MIHVAMIEDNPQFRQNFQAYCESSEYLSCTFAVESVEKFMRLYKPDIDVRILLLDINLPGISGIDAIGGLKRLLPEETDIVMYTVFNDPDDIFKALCAGATGYMLKNQPLKNLEEQLVSMVEEGGSALSSSVARRIVQYFSPKQKNRSEIENVELKPIERQIVHYLMEGMTYPEIAAVMSLSVQGVKYHQRSIFKKLNISSRNEIPKIFPTLHLPNE
ncbi:MAG: response regulator transcription factor [Saprospiraceae bacterium]|nr:response regulator transcription factor [Saprospiraceae bacterium]